MKILIASGGSGGHIFPAVALAKELEKKNAEIFFAASRRVLDRDILKNTSYKKAYLSANPMPYKFGLRAVVFLFKLCADSINALFIILKFRPDVIVGFGGYTSGAVLLLASKMKIKTVIHEQNLVPGRTNRFLDRRVNRVAVSFEETKKYFKNKNVVFTGNPLRSESLRECRSEAFAKMELEKDKLTVLVMGGSQGARSLNNLVSRALTLLSSEKKKRLQLIHIAGRGNSGALREFYLKNGMNAKVFDFIENINEAYSSCDLAVSRSGAAAVFELAFFAKPMILIPFPNEKNNQRFNAEAFAEKNAAIYRDEKTLTESGLKDLIDDLIDKPDMRKTLAENAKNLSTRDAARKLAEEVARW